MFEELETLLGQWLSAPWMRALALAGAAILVGYVVRFVLTTWFARLAGRTGTDLDDRIIRILARPVFVTFVLIGGYLAVLVMIPKTASDPVTGVNAGKESELLALRITQTLALLVWVGAIFRVCRPLLDALARLADRVTWIDSRTVPVIDNFGRVVLFGLAVYMMLMVWDLDPAPWLASAGIVGLAVGFAAKDSLANLFGGLFIIADAPYVIGDYIVLDSGERGQVTKIGLRSTRILTRDDVEITIPNAQIAAAKITNQAGGRWQKMRIRVKVGVAYGSDIAQVKELMLAVARDVEHAVAEPEPRVRFRALGESSLDFELMVWIEHPELRGRTVDALLTGVYNRFGAEGVEIPFPQRTLHLPQPLTAKVVEEQ